MTFNSQTYCSSCYVLSLSLLLICSSVLSTPIDNGVVGTPKVECGVESITVTVITKNPFLGRVFVKGMSHNADCSRQFTNSSLDNTTSASLEIKFATCGMQRQRKLSPMPLLEEGVTIVISFHSIFITKVDKAYNIQCQYSPKTMATVLYNFNVSMLPTETLNVASGPLPECAYEIRKGSINGPLVQYAQVGEQLFHRWMCFGDVKMLVRNCYVTDGGSDKFHVIDTRGCAVDFNIVGDLKYDTNGQSAWVESHAFKFADTTSLAFACSIKVCQPSKEDCSELTPPNCHIYQRTTPQSRSHDSPIFADLGEDEVDVSSASFNVLDSRISIASNYRDEDLRQSDSTSTTLTVEESDELQLHTSTTLTTQVCLSKVFVVTIVVTIVGTSVPFLVGVAAFFLVLRRNGKTFAYRAYF